VNNLLLPIGLGLFLLALMLLVLLLNERRTRRARLRAEQQRALGLPEGDLVYEDADGQGETLSSNEYPLIGKPDYIVQLANGRLVPVELKLSVKNASAPYSNHQVQVAAYCLILESYSEAESMPTHGIVRYSDRDFIIDYTPSLRKKVIRLLSEMERCSEHFPPPLTRQKAAKCRSCVFQPICVVGQGK
jgi:CRISPR-associated exonuclease Cas4